MSQETDAIEVTCIYGAGMLAAKAFGESAEWIPFYHGKSVLYMKVASIELYEDERGKDYNSLLIRGEIVNVGGAYLRSPAKYFIMYDPKRYFGLLCLDDEKDPIKENKQKRNNTVQYNLLNISIGNRK